jgi:hypothetical protein
MLDAGQFLSEIKVSKASANEKQRLPTMFKLEIKR